MGEANRIKEAQERRVKQKITFLKDNAHILFISSHISPNPLTPGSAVQLTCDFFEALENRTDAIERGEE